MLIKNAYVFSESILGEGIGFDFKDIDLSLSLFKENKLTDCSQEQSFSEGWLPTFGFSENEASYFEGIEGFFFISYGLEEKKLPDKLIDYELKKLISRENIDITTLTGEDRATLKERVFSTLLADTAPTPSRIDACIDFNNNRIIVNTSSAKNAERVTSLLRKTFGTCTVKPFNVPLNWEDAFTYLAQEKIIIDDLIVCDEIEMVDPSKKSCKSIYKGLDIDSSEIQSNLTNGWKVNKIMLAVDREFAFTIGLDLVLKKIKYGEVFNDDFERKLGDGSDKSSLDYLKTQACLSIQYINIALDYIKKIAKSFSER